MKIGHVAPILVALCGLANSENSALYAHHSFEAEFNVNKPVHLEGKVVQIEWANPHVHIDVAVKDASQVTTIWHCELPSVNHTIEHGVNRNTISIGGEILLDGFAALSGGQLIGTSKITIKATGKNFIVPEMDWFHSYAAIYDNSKQVQLTGKVVAMEWMTHPAARLHFIVAAPDGKSQNWTAELAPSRTLERGGWTKTILAAGDLIKIDGHAARDGSRMLLAQNVAALAIGGTTLPTPRALLGKLP